MPLPKPQTLRFFDMMFTPELFEDEFKVSIWNYPSKKTRWAGSAAEAAATVAASPANQNVYFGLGMIKDPPKRGRGKEQDVGAITSLYLDIDIDDGHVERAKAGRLPKTKKQAKEIIARLGLPPSILVFSGHGYQAYWLFKEPWVFEDDEERARAKALCKAWNDTARLCAHDLGYTVDSTFDLSRVFRAPGSMNRKSTPVIECMLIEPEENERIPLYIQDDFDDFIAPDFLTLEGSAHKSNTVVIAVESVIPRESVGLPLIVVKLCKNDPKFKQTWERKRTDLTDQSASSYDLSVATMLVMAGADDQTIADAILHWRTNHHEDVDKAHRRDYIMRTLSKARTVQVAEQSAQKIMDISYEANPKKPQSEKNETSEDRSDREKIMKLVSRALGVQITKIIKHGVENSIYSFVLSDGTDLTIGSMKALLNQDEVRARLAEATSVVIPACKKQVWHRQVGVMLRATVLIENADATRAGMIVGWLERYLNHGGNTMFFDDNWTDALMHNDPFVREERLHIHCPSLRKFIRIDTGEPVERPVIHDALRLIGFSSMKVNGKYKSVPVCRTYWTCAISKLDEVGIPKKIERKKKDEGKDHPL